MASPITWGELSIAALLGGLIGSFITHLFAYWRDNKKEFRDASRRCRAAFIPELADLDPSRRDSRRPTFDPFLKDALPKYREAVTEFSFYLPEKEREGFKKAFDTYVQGINEGEYDVGLTMTSSTPEGQVTKTGSYNLFQERVRPILKYAEYKPWYKRF